MKRKGLGKNKGRGYRNLISKDKQVHSDSAKGMKQPQNINYIPYRKKTQKNQVPDFINNEVLTENQVLLLRRRLNDGKITISEIFGEDEKCFRLTPEQTRKGLDYLNNLRVTPSGRIRKNNPFGQDEDLSDFDYFELCDFYNISNNLARNYMPIYRVVMKDGDAFEYYYNGRGITIIG